MIRSNNDINNMIELMNVPMRYVCFFMFNIDDPWSHSSSLVANGC
jgi:hypothetical protein